jgi:hypothetical protein
MGWKQRSYAGYSRTRYAPASVVENPLLGARLEKIKKEVTNPKTKEFLDSLSDFFLKKGGLTERQLTSFEKIESRFSPHEQAKLVLWEKEYRKQYLSDAKIIAEYYMRSGYYTTIATNIITDDKFVPSQAEYSRMANNKYAMKVLEASKAFPRFEKNAQVQLRSTIGNTGYEYNLRSLRSRICFVLANDLPIRNATAGAKRYKVLPMGASEPIEVDEKHLMKPNRKGKYS